MTRNPQVWTRGLRVIRWLKTRTDGSVSVRVSILTGTDASSSVSDSWHALAEAIRASSPSYVSLPPSPMDILKDQDDFCQFWLNNLVALSEEVELRRVLNQKESGIPRAPVIGLLWAYQETHPLDFQRKICFI